MSVIKKRDLDMKEKGVEAYNILLTKLLKEDRNYDIVRAINDKEY